MGAVPFGDNVVFAVQNGVGAPTSGTWEVGTVYVDSNIVPWICIQAGTPGKWVALGSVQQPQFEDDFVNSFMNNLWSSSTATGGFSAVAPPVAGGRNEVFGVLQATTGTSTTGRAGLRSGASLVRFEGTNIFEAWARIDIPTFAPDFSFKFGFVDNNNGDPTDGAFFEYNPLVDGANQFSINTIATTRSKQLVATNLVAGEWMDLHIVVNPATPSATFFVNDVQWGSPIITNLPLVSGRETGVGFEIRKTANNTTRSVLVDFVRARRNRTL